MLTPGKAGTVETQQNTGISTFEKIKFLTKKKMATSEKQNYNSFRICMKKSIKKNIYFFVFRIASLFW